MYFPLFLAWRFLKTASYERSISLMIKLCFGGIFIGTAALALTAAIMQGMERSTCQKIQGIHADLIIQSPYQRKQNSALNYEKIQKILTQEFTSEILASSPSATIHALVNQSKKADPTDPTVSLVAIIDPETAPQVSCLAATIINPAQQSLSDLLQDNNVLIGKTLAQQLQVTIGDAVSLTYPGEQQESQRQLTFDTHTAHIGGIFATGIDEFDSNGIFISQKQAQEQDLPYTITHINIKLKPGINDISMKEKLTKRFAPLLVYSWKDLYPSLMSALTLEKYGMLFILFLIILVASINMMSLLCMYITYKRKTIALLRSQGMSTRQIIHTFLAINGGITLSATLCGVICAGALAYILETYQLIKLPDAYYVSHITAHMDITIIITIVCFVILLSFITSWYPIRYINGMHIAHILKFES